MWAAKRRPGSHRNLKLLLLFNIRTIFTATRQRSIVQINISTSALLIPRVLTDRTPAASAHQRGSGAYTIIHVVQQITAHFLDRLREHSIRLGSGKMAAPSPDRIKLEDFQGALARYDQTVEMLSVSKGSKVNHSSGNSSNRRLLTRPQPNPGKKHLQIWMFTAM